MASQESKPVPVSSGPRSQVVEQLLRPLMPHLDREDVTEIAINRPGELWAKTFIGWELHEVSELTENFLRSLATSIVVYNGLQPKSINSVVLPGGQRGQIVDSPTAIQGTFNLIIRKHAMVAKTLSQLHDEGAFSAEELQDKSFNRPTEQEAAAQLARHDFGRLEPYEVELLRLKREGSWLRFLEACVENKRNMVICGKTGSGKTTFARSLIDKVPRTERIVTIEDVHELFLPEHPNRVHLLYGDGAGRVSADACLASCMRMSPDRIFLAELRGNEAWEYVNSLNTGHPGSITTTHANGALQAFDRISTLIKTSNVGRQLDLDVVRLVLYTTIDVILFFHERRMLEVFYDPIFAKAKMQS